MQSGSFLHWRLGHKDAFGNATTDPLHRNVEAEPKHAQIVKRSLQLVGTSRLSKEEEKDTLPINSN